MHRFSYSNIVATIALVASVGGGTAVAATHLARGSVGSRELKDRSVQTRDLARTARPASSARLRALVTDTMTSSDVLSALSTAVQGAPGTQGPQGPAGPQGAQGAPGIAGVTVRQDTAAAPANTTRSVTARCEAGERAIGGGGQLDRDDAGVLSRSAPLEDGAGWYVVVVNQSTTESTARAFVVCAKVGA